ncbi:phosphatidylinositol 4,5-bisphosphate 3-kinase catalytic subunit delta isoform-like isoform X2 [Rhynchophorus ferrugineus]|uniref:phosphatidylinositol 4,5-bisphosphate 3-kinase catalytic subunit delta isoform-like isoform X2 n=1 Tax=Rhynchophorus ferrugineus TaxID=354439 RepID=UPI003FCD6917
MVAIPAEYTADFWNQLPSEYASVQLTCLMPNGILILLKQNANASLSEIKMDLWKEASQYPLYWKLRDMSVYVFKVVNFMAEEEELTDESRQLNDIKPTGGILIITECSSNSADHSINVAIGHLIGKGLQDFDALNSSEINDFRFKMRKIGYDIAKQRYQGSWKEKLLYQYPPLLAKIHSTIVETLRDKKLLRVEIFYFLDNIKSDKMFQKFNFNIHPMTASSKLLELILSKKGIEVHLKTNVMHDYVLKVRGRDEYLVGEFPLIQLQYVQDCLLQNVTAQFVTIHATHMDDINKKYQNIDPLESRKTRSTSYNATTLRKRSIISSWNIEDNYAITICTASKLNCDIKKSAEYGIQAGLFYGGKPLCQPLKTDEKPVSDECEINFDVSLEFDIQVFNIPRNAKLCFVIYECNKSSKGTKPKKAKDSRDNQINPIAWANTSVYDFKGQLRTGDFTLYLWTYAEDIMSDDVLHPLGTIVNNPNTEYSTALTLVFKTYANDQIAVFPRLETVMDFAEEMEKRDLEMLELEKERKEREEKPEDMVDVERYLRAASDIESHDVHDQDKKFVWQHRRYLMMYSPDVFPKILMCIDWDKREDVSQITLLVRDWPKLPLEKALELLDYAYADPHVRGFAVECLKDMSDEDLLLYLLQLVQAIKHELYLENDLVKFLIRRALTNQRVGHFLFWYLRSEMQVPAVSVRFGLILEAYCRGCQEHMCGLQKQLRLIDKMKQCTEVVREKRDKEKAKIAMKECLGRYEYSVTRNLLDPSIGCSNVKIEKCRVMDSKMRPLWVVFDNSDPLGQDVYLIFKNGDDLRQDMLTLQMLKIMDGLWKREGLDLRMNPYNCISLEHRVGMIQVVLNAETIANIQKEKGTFTPTASFKKGPILAWLKDYNTTEQALNKAIEEFTMSCAGYCVATYVLGIADRHSDNIMVKQTGQLFHIDFGHILGHFKEKFGIRRERVPFVLTHDFVYVINKGQKQGNILEFKLFQKCCEKAFMILRKHGNLILSLFAMMISTGLPELSCEKDLQYLRDTLALSKSNTDATEHFRAKFNEALSNSWKTSLNWASHNISKNNKA